MLTVGRAHPHVPIHGPYHWNRTRKRRVRRRIIALIITLAIIGPGIIAGTWVAYYVAQHKHAAPTGYIHERTTGSGGAQALLFPEPGTEPAPLLYE